MTAHSFRVRNNIIKAGLGLAMVVAGSALPMGLGGAWGEQATKPPAIIPMARETALNETGVYPPEMRVGGFHGRYTMATINKSAVLPGNMVAFWASEAGVLKTDNYPKDEFIILLEGHLVTTDAEGTRREFRAGDTFILPKGWAGTWDMKTKVKKISVNY